MSSNPTELALQNEEATSSLDIFNPDRFQHALSIAKYFTDSQMVPAAFQRNTPNCIVALEIASRMRTSPLMVMQNLNIIHGKPSWGAAFIIGMINSCGRFTSLRYTYSGEKGTMTRGCVAHAISLQKHDNGEPLMGTEVTMQMAKSEGWLNKSGSKWQTMPELMLMYRAATFWGRMYAPDMLMGMSSAEEIIDIEATPVGGSSESEGTTTTEPTKRRNRGVAGSKTATEAGAELKNVTPIETPVQTEMAARESADVSYESAPPVTQAPAPEPTTPPPVTPPPAPVTPVTPAPTEPTKAAPQATVYNAEIAAFVRANAKVPRGYVLRIDLSGDEISASAFLDSSEESCPPVGSKVRAEIIRKMNATGNGYQNIITKLEKIS